MNVEQLLNCLEKSPKTSTYISLENLGLELGVRFYYDKLDEEQNDLTAYLHPLASWICTDTAVGLTFYFFKDEFVAVTSQSGRKMDENFHWISEEARKKVFDWYVEKYSKATLQPLSECLQLTTDCSSWMKGIKV